MKKIFFAMLMGFVVLISTSIVEATDVPGFYQVGGDYLTFTGREDTSKGFRVYGYDCSVDLNRQIRKLQNML